VVRRGKLKRVIENVLDEKVTAVKKGGVQIKKFFQGAKMEIMKQKLNEK